MSVTLICPTCGQQARRSTTAGAERVLALSCAGHGGPRPRVLRHDPPLSADPIAQFLAARAKQYRWGMVVLACLAVQCLMVLGLAVWQVFG